MSVSVASTFRKFWSSRFSFFCFVRSIFLSPLSPDFRPPSAALILVGNKSDMSSTQREVSMVEGMRFARKHGLDFLEVRVVYFRDLCFWGADLDLTWNRYVQYMVPERWIAPGRKLLASTQIVRMRTRTRAPSLQYPRSEGISD